MANTKKADKAQLVIKRNDSNSAKIDVINPKKTKKAEVKLDRAHIKDIIPRDPDTKYMGHEPNFYIQPDQDLRQSAIIRAMNWYNHFMTRREAREFLSEYTEQQGFTTDSKLMLKVDENEIQQSWGWLARMSVRGLDLTLQEKQGLGNEISRLLHGTKSIQHVSQTSGRQQRQLQQQVVKVKPNVQEIMRERTREAGGELEGIFDEFIQAATKYDYSGKTISVLSQRNIQPQHISILIDSWKSKLEEYEQVLEGRDRDLVQAYAHYTKTQIKTTIKFIEAVISDLNGYINIKRTQKAPRVRKPVSPEKLVSKLKYMKAFPDLKLESVHPSKIVGASEVWAYDTAKRKLHYYIADSHSQTLTVKGTAILGFDPVQSGIKTLRKPQEQLKEFMSNGIPASRKFFKDIKTTLIASKGRTNDDLVILKVK